EEVLLHLALEELARLGLDRRQAVFVDQHRLVGEPALPPLLRDVLVDPAAELAGIGHVLEPLRFAPEHHAVNLSHRSSPSRSAGARAPRYRSAAPPPHGTRRQRPCRRARAKAPAAAAPPA